MLLLFLRLPQVHHFTYQADLIGTSQFQAVVQDFCEIHGVSVSDILPTLEKEEFDYSELELKRIGWRSIKDLSFLIKGLGQGFETLRIYVGKWVLWLDDIKIFLVGS